MTDDKIPDNFKQGFMDGLNEILDIKNIIVLSKDVRDYGGRKRINITNSDGLVKDDAVVVLRKSDYDTLIKDYNRLIDIVNSMDNQKVTADAIGEKLVTPLKDSYDTIISDLKQDLKDKDTEINRLKAICHDYDKQVYSMGLLDILRHKNREISQDFNSKIWITRPDDTMVTDAEVRKLNEPDRTDADSPDNDNDGGNNNE